MSILNLNKCFPECVVCNSKAKDKYLMAVLDSASLPPSGVPLFTHRMTIENIRKNNLKPNHTSGYWFFYHFCSEVCQTMWKLQHYE
jgi:hypothetical protein